MVCSWMFVGTWVQNEKHIVKPTSHSKSKHYTSYIPTNSWWFTWFWSLLNINSPILVGRQKKHIPSHFNAQQTHQPPQTKVFTSTASENMPRCILASAWTPIFLGLERKKKSTHVLSPTAWKILACFCAGTLHNFDCYVYRNLSEPHPLSAPQPSGTSSPSEPHQLSAKEPASRTVSAIDTRTIRNLISHLHRNHPEPCLLSAPEPSGTSSAICTRTLSNLPEPSGTWGCSCTGSHQSYSGLKTP